MFNYMPTCMYCGDTFDTDRGKNIHISHKHEGETPEYQHLHTPVDKPKEEWEAVERRTWLFQKWLNYGSWQRLERMDLAAKFDVHPTTIYNDKKHLEEYVIENPDLQEEIRAQSLVGYQRIVDKAMSKGELGEARRALDSLNEFMERRGKEEDERSGEGGDIVINEKNVKVNLVEAVDDNISEARKKLRRGEWPGLDVKKKDEQRA